MKTKNIQSKKARKINDIVIRIVIGFLIVVMSGTATCLYLKNNYQQVESQKNITSSQKSDTHLAGNLYNQVYSTDEFTSQYHLFTNGVDINRPVGLVVSFHGDGAYEFNNPNSTYSLDADGSDGIVRVARDHNMIVLSILTPDIESGNKTWWLRGDNYADYVYSLINNLYQNYDIDKNQVWLIGYSGGAQFITQYYLSKYGGSDQFRGGGALMFAGGDTPQNGSPQKGTVHEISQEVKDNFSLWWGAGTNDGPDNSGWEGGFISAKNGQAYYESIGFKKTSHLYPAGWCHDTSSSCDSFEGKFAEYFRQQVDLK